MYEMIENQKKKKKTNSMNKLWYRTFAVTLSIDWNWFQIRCFESIERLELQMNALNYTLAWVNRWISFMLLQIINY